MSLFPGSLNPLNTSIGHNQDENHVSSTSSSCVKIILVDPGPELVEGPYCLLYISMASFSFRATTKFPSASYQAGIRCPHQSWRLMHQSRIFSIQLRYRFLNFTG